MAGTGECRDHMLDHPIASAARSARTTLDWKDAAICTRLIVPSDVASLRVIRVTAAAAASDVIEDIERLDSLRLAVDELAVALIEVAPTGRPFELEVRCRSDEVRVSGRVDGNGLAPRLSDVGATLVASGTTRYDLVDDGDTIAFHATFATRPID